MVSQELHLRQIGLPSSNRYDLGNLLKKLVPPEGLEPPPGYPEQILSLSRLPVPPRGPIPVFNDNRYFGERMIVEATAMATPPARPPRPWAARAPLARVRPGTPEGRPKTVINRRKRRIIPRKQPPSGDSCSPVREYWVKMQQPSREA